VAGAVDDDQLSTGDRTGETARHPRRREQIAAADDDRRRQIDGREMIDLVVVEQAEEAAMERFSIHHRQHLARRFDMARRGIGTERQPNDAEVEVVVTGPIGGHSCPADALARDPQRSRQTTKCGARSKSENGVGRRRYEHQTGDAFVEHGPMTPSEAQQCHPTHRVADDDGVAQVEHRQHLGDVVRQSVQTVTS